MPRYVLNGFGFDRAGISTANLVLRTETGVTSFSYQYVDRDDGLIAANIRGDFTLSYDGTGLNPEQIEVGFVNISWGAGRQTKILGVLSSDFVFLGAVAGDGIPLLHRDQGHVFAEFGEITFREAPIASGPYRPGQSIPLTDMFDADLAGPVRHGTQGADALSGGRRDDLLVGQRGADVLKGNGGNDTLMLGRGDDRGVGGAGSDMISGYLGDDRLFGGKGADRLLGGDGDDLLRGGSYRDRLEGGLGQDRLFGEAGTDRLFGNGGRDRLDGGRGDDLVTGGGSADVFVFSRNYDRDRITDFGNGADRLRLDGSLWTGEMTAREVVLEFSTRSGGNITFDFGDGDVLVLRNYTYRAGLDAFIDIV